MKLLSIGNSFSQDAQRYLHRIAKKENVQTKCVNLYIGGCTLEKHYMNMLGDCQLYELEINGENSQFCVKMKDVLLSDSWDVITFQQASRLSPYFDTYEPYLSKLVEYVKIFAPKAKIMLHQTWAYEQNSAKLNDEMGFSDQHEMIDLIEEAYKNAAEAISADAIIPCGRAMMNAIDECVGKIHRDTFHADLGVGRYLLGLVWYKTIFGENAKNDFCDFDVKVDPKQLEIVRHVVKNI